MGRVDAKLGSAKYGGPGFVYTSREASLGAEIKYGGGLGARLLYV